MERILHRLRGIQLSLGLIILICTTLFIWMLDRTPFLSTQNQLLPVTSSSAAENVSVRPNDEVSHGASRPVSGGNLSSSSEAEEPGRRACEYGSGRWVVDDRRPLYSGHTCKQWLSEMWACRLTRRTDFAYEKLKWKPEHCEVGEEPETLLRTRLRNRTLAFVGDSLGRQQFQSMMCMLTRGAEDAAVVDVGSDYGLVRSPSSARPDGWAYLFLSTNTTVLYYWSASLCDLQPLGPSAYAMHLDRPPSFLRRFTRRFDVLVLNTGHHWNRGKINANRWVMHARGSPRVADIAAAKNLTVHSIVRWAHRQIRARLLARPLRVFYRTISPRHFVRGEWNTGGSCNTTAPSAVGRLLLRDDSLDPSPTSAVRGTLVTLLDITTLSRARDEAHISRFSIRASPGAQDCLHWCLPGVPDTWNELLLAQL